MSEGRVILLLSPERKYNPGDYGMRDPKVWSQKREYSCSMDRETFLPLSGWDTLFLGYNQRQNIPFSRAFDAPKYVTERNEDEESERKEC